MKVCRMKWLTFLNAHVYSPPPPLDVPNGSAGAPPTRNADVKFINMYLSSAGMVFAKMVMLKVLMVSPRANCKVPVVGT